MDAQQQKYVDGDDPAQYRAYVRKKKVPASERPSFAIGEKVRHNKFRGNLFMVAERKEGSNGFEYQIKDAASGVLVGKGEKEGEGQWYLEDSLSAA